MIIKRFSDLHSVLYSGENGLTGCLVDNSILFAVSYELDVFNEDAVHVLNILTDRRLPVFANFNIRTEFIELHRRVSIPEGLIDLLDDVGDSIDAALTQKLKSLRTSYRRAQMRERAYKLDDKSIKIFRALLERYRWSEKDGWQWYCENYLAGVIQGAWNQVNDLWNLNFISLRNAEENHLLHSPVTWEGMVELVERFGLGAMDAMILNLFLCSDLNILLTADSDLVYCARKLNLKDKYIFVPDALAA